MPHEERKLPVLETQIVPGIDKSVLAVAAPRRYRNREHLRSMAGGLRSQLSPRHAIFARASDGLRPTFWT
jgi:hypothetical protein